MMQLRRFNQHGIDAFENALDRIGAGEDVGFSSLLTDPEFTEVLSAQPVVDVAPFSNRFKAAQYLHALLEQFEKAVGDIERDRGLWAWLAAAWLDVLAPKDESGMRKLGARARWVPAVDDYKTYYRHLLAGPYRIYRAHQDDPSRVMAVLATPVGQPGDVVRATGFPPRDHHEPAADDCDHGSLLPPSYRETKIWRCRQRRGILPALGRRDPAVRSDLGCLRHGTVGVSLPPANGVRPVQAAVTPRARWPTTGWWP